MTFVSSTPIRRRHFLGLAAAATGGLFVASGCSTDGSKSGGAEDLKDQATGAMDGFAADSQFTATAPFTVSMLWTDWPDLPVTKTWQVFDEIKKRTNVELKLTHIPFSDATEKRSLLLSAGDAPAAIPLIYTGDETPFVSSGAILPMSDYVQHMPNFQKYVKEWNLQGMIDNLKQADGKYYMVPGLQEVSVPVFTLIIRKDVFDKVGAPPPETWDDLRTGLRLIKKAYPASMPLADGFEAQSLINYASHAFGTRAGWGFGDGTMPNASGDLEYCAIGDGYKQMLEYFNSLVTDGLLDPESLTASNDGNGGGSVAEKIAQNKVFAASGSNGTVIDFAKALNETVGPRNFELLQIAPPGGPAGMVVEPRNFWHGFCLNSKLKDSENLLATLQFMDWMYYSPDAREFWRWGVKDQTYTKDASGKIALKPQYSLGAFDINPKGKTDIQKALGFSTFPAEATESRALKESYNSKAFINYIDTVLKTRKPRDPNPPAPLTEGELEQATLLATPLKDAVDTNTLKFILGNRPLSDWDKYVSELKAKGLDQYLEIKNKARQRFKKEHG